MNETHLTSDRPGNRGFGVWLASTLLRLAAVVLLLVLVFLIVGDNPRLFFWMLHG